MVRDQCLTSRLLIKILTGCFLVAFLSGCSSEYGTIGPSLEGVSSITGGAMQALAGLPGGSGSADGLGSEARFNSPRGVVASGTDLFVADQNNHIIRKIDTLTGEVSTFAGNPGTPGLNDGIGKSARFKAPEGIETDGIYLYVTDTQNHTIRKVEISTGNVITLAGMRGQSGYTDGAGQMATFSGPAAVTLLGVYLYVADTDNHIIRRVHKDTGYTETIAGAPELMGSSDGIGFGAMFNYPLGIANDGEYVYIADTYNQTIRRLDPRTGIVETLAGLAYIAGYNDGSFNDAKFYYPHGLCVNNGVLYVADYSNEVIRTLDLQNKSVGTLTGIPNNSGSNDGPYDVAKFNSPSDLVIIGDDIYVAEAGNSKIRKIDINTGAATTLAGKATNQGIADGIGEDSSFYTPGGIIKDGNTLYVADTYNNTIRMINISTGEVSTLAGTPRVSGTADSSESPAVFNSPTDIIVDEKKENIYIIDTDNNSIRRMNLGSGEIRTFAGDYRENPDSQDGVGVEARFNAPRRGVRLGDIIYVADTGNHAIRAVNTVTAEVTTVAGDSKVPGWLDRVEGEDNKAMFNSPGDIATDGINMYISDTGNHVIRKFDPATGVVTTLAGVPGTSGLLNSKAVQNGVTYFNTPTFQSPEGILWENGILYISDTANNVMRKLDLSNGEVSLLAGDVSCVEESEVVDGITKAKLICTGQPTGVSSYNDSSDGTGRTTSFSLPTAINTKGLYLYVMDTGGNRIRRINKETGETKTLSYTKDKGIPLKSPSGGDISGNFIYLADKGNQIIRLLEISEDISESPLIIIAGTVGSAGYRYSPGYSAQFNRPVGIASDGKGNIYVADTGNHTIRKIVLETKEVTTLAGSPGTRGFLDSMFGSPIFNFPRGICYVADHLYVADSGNHLIRRVNVLNGYVGLVAGLSDYVKNIGSPGTSDSTGAAAGFNDPRGITSDGTYLFVADTGNHSLRRILRVTGEVKTIAGMPGEAGYNNALGFDARFYYPKGITVDGDHIYVADSGNNVIRRVNKHTGEVLTFSGKPGQSSFITGNREEARYNNVVSMTTDSTTPYVFFTDGMENVVGKVSKN